MDIKRMRLKAISRACLTGVVLVSLVMVPLGIGKEARANWLDNWYQNVMTSGSGPNYFETQQRGYMTFGSFGLRLPTRSDYLFSIEKPHLRVGCGGIDLFLGGFSFMNPEYLVQKAQAMIQAAPFIAFDIALSTLFPEGSAIIKKVMSIIDALNQIQISECGITIPKTVVDLVKNPSGFFDLQGEKHARDQQQKGLSDIWHRFWNKYVRVTDSGSSINRAGSGTYGLSPTVSAWLNGSESVGLVDFLARDNKIDSEVAKIFKAYVGDLRFTKNEEGSLFNIRVDQACSEAHVKDIFEKGTIYVHIGSGCVPEDANTIINDVQKALREAYNKMLSKQSLPPKFIALAQASPTPLYHIVRYAILTRNPGFLESYAPVLAKSLFYAGLLDLSKKMKALFKNMIYYHDAGQNANPLGKELKIALNEGVRELEKRFDEFENKIVQLYRANQGEVMKAIQEAISIMQFMQLVEKSLNVNLSGMMAYIK